MPIIQFMYPSACISGHKWICCMGDPQIVRYKCTRFIKLAPVLSCHPPLSRQYFEFSGESPSEYIFTVFTCIDVLKVTLQAYVKYDHSGNKIPYCHLPKWQTEGKKRFLPTKPWVEIYLWESLFSLICLFKLFEPVLRTAFTKRAVNGLTQAKPFNTGLPFPG